MARKYVSHLIVQTTLRNERTNETEQMIDIYVILYDSQSFVLLVILYIADRLTYFEDLLLLLLVFFFFLLLYQQKHIVRSAKRREK